MWPCGGGLGGIVNGTVGLQAGQTLLIVVGQAGQPSSYEYYGGRGGGATFVLSANQSLIVAGGGGGGSRVLCNSGIEFLFRSNTRANLIQDS